MQLDPLTQFACHCENIELNDAQYLSVALRYVPDGMAHVACTKTTGASEREKIQKN